MSEIGSSKQMGFASDVSHELPYAGPKAFWVVLAAAVALCWPMLFTTAPLGYFDTASYHSGGASVVDKLRQIISSLMPEAAVVGGTASGGDVAAEGQRDAFVSIRSAPYSLFLFATSGTRLGLVLPVILQTCLTLYLLLALIPHRLSPGPLRLTAGLAFVGLATTLPWFASYAMPDILVAAMFLYFAILLGSIDKARGWQVVLIGAMGLFAVLSHYANPPLALALCCAVLGWRLFTRRLTLLVAAMAILPVLLPLPVNLAANVATDSGASVAPKRLPLVLARSIADGPAKWYLEESCASEGYAICELFDDIPDNLGTFLWSPNGIRSATEEQMARIQAEEFEILVETMKAYPVQQTRTLVRNAALQLVSVGTGEILPRSADASSVFATATEDAEGYLAIGISDIIVKFSTAFSLAVLLFMAARRMLPRYLALSFALLMLAILVNGLVFGGLSAPVDRYQSRIAWLFPVFAVLAWFELSRRNSSGAQTWRTGSGND